MYKLIYYNKKLEHETYHKGDIFQLLCSTGLA